MKVVRIELYKIRCIKRRNFHVCVEEMDSGRVERG